MMSPMAAPEGTVKTQLVPLPGVIAGDTERNAIKHPPSLEFAGYAAVSPSQRIVTPSLSTAPVFAAERRTQIAATDPAGMFPMERPVPFVVGLVKVCEAGAVFSFATVFA